MLTVVGLSLNLFPQIELMSGLSYREARCSTETGQTTIAPALSHFPISLRIRVGDPVGHHLAQPLMTDADEIAADIGLEYVVHFLDTICKRSACRA